MPSIPPWSVLLAAPEMSVYKQDRRSRVWRVGPKVNGAGEAAADQSWVIKRFDHNPLRQRLALCLGLHPAQRERAQSRKLIDAGLPVIPVDSMYVQHAGLLGCRVHLATAYRGQSMQIRKKQGDFVDQSAGHSAVQSDAVAAMLASVGAIAAAMLESGWVFRDFKTANILIDEQYMPWLIDVGSARRGRPCTAGSSGGRAWRMLRMLDHTMTQDGWSASQRRDTLARPLAILCPEPTDHAYDRLARIVLK